MKMRNLTRALIVIGVLSFAVSSHAQWEWKNPVPEANEIFDMIEVDGGPAIFVGSNGAIIRSQTGAAFESVNNPLRGTPFICLSIAPQGTNTLLVSANNGSILRSSDKGATWGLIAPPPVPVQKLRTCPNDTVWAFGSLGSLASTGDGGNTWKEYNTGVTTVIYDVVFPEPNKMIAVCGSGIILTSFDNGLSWSQSVPSIGTDIISVDFADSLHGVALQKPNYILRTSDGGQTWSDSSLGVNELRKIRFAYFSNRNFGWIVSNSFGTALYTTNSGNSWNAIEVDTTGRYAFQAAVAYDGGKTVFAGLGGGIFSVENPEQPATQYGSGFREHLYNVSGLSQDAAWVFGADAVYYTANGGADWSANKAPDDSALHTGYALSATRLIGGGKEGQVYLSTDAGDTWTKQELAAKGQIEQIVFVDQNIGWLAGRHGTIARSIDGGTSWIEVDPGVTDDFYGISAISDAEAWIVGDAGKAYRTDNSGQTWTPVQTGTSNPLRAVAMLSSQTVWIGGAQTLLQTTNGGVQWTPRVVALLDVVYRISFKDNDNGIVLLSRSLARTKDGGTTFYRTDFPAQGQQAFSLVPSGHIWLVGDYGATLRYTPSPVIRVAPTVLDFGGVYTTRTRDITFEVQSVGETALNVTNVAVFGAGFTFEGGTLGTLAPGQNSTMTIRFAPSDTGQLRGFANVFSNAVSGFSIVELRGIGLDPGPSPFAHSPSPLDFGAVRVGQDLQKTIAIQNVGTRTVLIDSVMIEGADMLNYTIAQDPPFVFTAGMSDSLVVLFAPRKAGKLDGEVALYTRDVAAPRYAMAVKGTGLNPTISPARDTVNFGAVPAGFTQFRSVYVRNQGNMPLTIISQTLINGDVGEFGIVQPAATTIAQGDSSEVRLSFTPTVPDLLKWTNLVFESDDALNPTVSIVLIGNPPLSTDRPAPAAVELLLHSPAPNPLSLTRGGETVFSFGASRVADLTLALYDALGREVRTVVSGQYSPGMHSVTVNGRGLEPGIYFAELRASSASAKRVKLVVVK